VERVKNININYVKLILEKGDELIYKFRIFFIFIFYIYIYISIKWVITKQRQFFQVIQQEKQ
jgi:hypothetical protein